MSQTVSNGPRERALDGKVVIVTGASRGIGRAIALRLASEGARMVLAARDRTALETVAGDITGHGGEAVISAADLRPAGAPEALAQAAQDAFGAIDIVVNNAGSTRRGEFLELTDDAWAEGFELKFFAAMRLVRAAWPMLKSRRGSVLNIIGIGGRTPGAEFTIGGSVNGACLSFTKALSDIGVRDGVQVNAINPGFVRTDRLRTRFAAAAAAQGISMDDAARDMVQRAGVVRIGEPEDVAALAAFILSPEGSLLQGALIDLDGGQTKTI